MHASASDLRTRLRAAIRDVPDFPSPGILFKDITPVLADPSLMHDVIAAMAAPVQGTGITHVVGVESRGFLFGMPLAMAIDAAFAPARKPGKLPWRTEREAYALEYRQDVLEMHVDAFEPRRDGGGTGHGTGAARARVLVVDDVLATGGTAAATCRLVERLGGEVAGICVLMELSFLNGRTQLVGRTIHALTTY